MKCPNCSEEFEPSAAFCGNCGFQLQQAASAQAPAPMAAQHVPPAAMQPPVAPVAPDPQQQPQFQHQPMPMSAPMAPQAPMAPGVPGYAVGQPKHVPGSGHLTAALILGILSIPGAVIPLVGLVLSITAIVLASKHHHAGTGKMVTSIVLGSLGLLLSLAAWGYNINHRAHNTGFAPNNVTTKSIVMVNHSTANYQELIARNH